MLFLGKSHNSPLVASMADPTDIDLIRAIGLDPNGANEPPAPAPLREGETGKYKRTFFLERGIRRARCRDRPHVRSACRSIARCASDLPTPSDVASAPFSACASPEIPFPLQPARIFELLLRTSPAPSERRARTARRKGGVEVLGSGCR
jgi:hypothetical protein